MPAARRHLLPSSTYLSDLLLLPGNSTLPTCPYFASAVFNILYRVSSSPRYSTCHAALPSFPGRQNKPTAGMYGGPTYLPTTFRSSFGHKLFVIFLSVISYIVFPTTRHFLFAFRAFQPPYARQVIFASSCHLMVLIFLSFLSSFVISCRAHSHVPHDGISSRRRPMLYLPCAVYMYSTRRASSFFFLFYAAASPPATFLPWDIYSRPAAAYLRVLPST